jgi:hypothetical protein
MHNKEASMSNKNTQHKTLMGNKSAQQEVLTSTKRTQQRSVAKQQECATHKGGVNEHQECTSRRC